ncbi:MAG: TRAM domain-containing protein, partial [Candidatus Dadabacteria bacterium]
MADTVRLTVERLADTGEGIGRWRDGRICFVPAVLPGECVEVVSVEERARLVRGRVQAVIKAAPERIEPDCPAFGTCGGCDWRMVNEHIQCQWRRDLLQQQLEHRGFTVAVGELRPSAGRRCRVQVEHRDGQWGFLARRSKQLVPTGKCPAMEPALEAVVAAFAQLRPVYHGRIHWRCDERGTISAICGPADDADSLYSALLEAGASGAVIGRRSFGDPAFQYSVAGVRLVAPPHAFTQV